MGGAKLPVAAVVVNYNAAGALNDCVISLQDAGVGEIVVVDNGSTDGSVAAMRSAGLDPKVVESVRNLGYGAAANLGVKTTAEPFVLICNPDLVVRPGAVRALLERIEQDDSLAIVGPMILDADGQVYPSGREFPGLPEAIGHAFVGLIWGGNPWTRRYRHLGADQHRSRPADWVSGSCFLVRRLAFDSVAGFDEAYFMYVEDVDLCWRLRRAGWQIWYEPAGEVVHEQGLSASQHPYRMLAAHHRSMWRFAARTADGRERALLPLMAAGLVARLLLAWGDHLLRPVREEVLTKAKVKHRARGEFQP